jgi:Spy/CpxP family protein refolding chaperone
MKLTAAILAATLAISAVSYAAVVDPTEPPATPAGGAPEAGIGTATVVGAAITIAVIVAIAGGGGNDNTTTTTSNSNSTN